MPAQTDKISVSTPDWSREAIRSFWDPGRKLLRSIRRYQTARARGGVGGRLRAKYWVLNHRFWSVVSSCDIPLNTQIGGGLLLPHPLGIVVHPSSTIGPNCLLFQQVTLAGSVSVAGGVDIGAGAKIIGPLSLGERSRVGANAVVLEDVAAWNTVAGIPARIVRTQPEETRG